MLIKFDKSRPRRSALRLILGGGGLAADAWLPWSWAASTWEEPLTDAMRGVLGARVRAPLGTGPAGAEALDWQGQVWSALGRWLPEPALRQELSAHLWYEARRAGLSLSLVLGLIETESGFRKHAISPAGAMGYAQVMPFWTRLIGDGDASALFRTQPNLRYGCVILRHYLDQEKGDLTLALGRYNGTRGQWSYPQRVLEAARRWRMSHD
jgi:soluble lytic murein transglycosylase-like protein